MPAPARGDPPYDLAELLGAKEVPRTERFTVYMADRDRESRPVEDIETWIQACMDLLRRINGGVTRLPWASGQWRDEQGGSVTEQTALIYSYVEDAETFLGHISKIRDFLHEYGRQTNQGEVMVELFGEDEEGLYSRAYFIPREAWEN